jgi:hypothetical protein
MVGAAPVCTLDVSAHSTPGKYVVKTRKLIDGFQFRNNNFYDPRTAEMRNFLEDLRSPHNSETNNAHLKTIMDPDSTSTTGNASPIDCLSDLMPAYDSPVVSDDVYRLALAYQLAIKTKLNRLNPDIFSEDPSIFLGDKDTYFVIIKKRGLIFFYLSRMVLYGMLVYLLLHLILRDFRREKLDLAETEFAPQKTRMLSGVQLAVLITVTLFSVGTLLYVEKPKQETSQVFSSLFYSFKEISGRVASVIGRNKAVNARRLSVPGRSGGRFVVQDRLSQSQSKADSDLQKVNAFLNASSHLTSITDNIPAIVLSLTSLGLLGLFVIGKKDKSVGIQFGMFVVASLGVAYLLGTLDRFVVGFSGLNDMCLGILKFGQNPVLPYQGFGITSFLGSSVKNEVFQQLYVNTIAQNSALVLFNGELKAMGRDPVENAAQAVKTTAYLRSLESSNQVLEDYANLLESNTQSLRDLLSLSGGNVVKRWVIDAQRDLCLTSSRHIMNLFGIYIALIFLLGAAALLSLSLMWWFVQLKKRKQADNFLLHADHFENRFISE